jgi:hypothetical protein
VILLPQSWSTGNAGVPYHTWQKPIVCKLILSSICHSDEKLNNTTMTTLSGKRKRKGRISRQKGQHHKDMKMCRNTKQQRDGEYRTNSSRR